MRVATACVGATSIITKPNRNVLNTNKKRCPTRRQSASPFMMKMGATNIGYQLAAGTHFSSSLKATKDTILHCFTASFVSLSKPESMHSTQKGGGS
jgi:hypothetical protein